MLVDNNIEMIFGLVFELFLIQTFVLYRKSLYERIIELL